MRFVGYESCPSKIPWDGPVRAISTLKLSCWSTISVVTNREYSETTHTLLTLPHCQKCDPNLFLALVTDLSKMPNLNSMKLKDLFAMKG